MCPGMRHNISCGGNILAALLLWLVGENRVLKFLLEHLKIFLNCASNFEKNQSIPFFTAKLGGDS